MDPVQISHLRILQYASQTGKFVPFIGAGVSNNSGVPTWKALISEMKKELPESIVNETDDLKVAQAYRDVRGEKEYLDKVKEVLRHNRVIPNPIHEAIFDLNPSHVLTTNYDDLLEQELENEFKQFDIIREDSDLPSMKYQSAVVKMHGDFLRNNIVLTETDYYNYSKTFPLIRAFVQSIFAHKVIAFIGFSFADLNLKMILNEVKNILGEKMQRVYLLSLSEPDALTIKYFEKRYINIVYLTDEEVKILLKGVTKSSAEEERLSKLPSLGRKLYNYLRIIQHTDFNNANNPISYVWNKIGSYQDEMRVYGRGLRYFLPHNQGEFQWHEYSHGVQTFHLYFKELAKQLKTKEGLISFINSIGRDNVKSMLKVAYFNSLYSIDEVIFLNEKFYINIESYNLGSSIDYIGRFDFNGLASRLKTLSRRNITGEILDLEIGYVYYILGDYYKAYLEFNKVLPIAWRKGKYVLYFICLYNLYKLRYAVKNQLILSKVVDGSVISDKLCRINPSETLSKLELPIEFRKIFQDILADRYLNEHLVKAEKLKEELHSQRVSAENGAASLNSNIVALIDIYRREEKFCKDNFLLCDFNSSSEALKRDVVIGILNSHATKDYHESPWYFGNTKLETLDAETTSILISSLKFSEIDKIFRQYKITSLSLDDDGRKYIRTCILNLKDNSFDLFWCEFVRERVLNLLYVLSLVHVDGIEINIVYSIIKWMAYIPNIRINMKKFVPGIIEKNAPTAEIAKELLFTIFSLDEIDTHWNKIVKGLCDSIAKSNIRINILEKVDSRVLPMDMLLYLAEVIPLEEKESYYKWALPILKNNFLYYVLFLHLNKLCPDDVKEFKESLMTFTNEFEMNYGAVGCIISEWRENSDYSSLWESIDECAQKRQYLRFALSPFEFEDKNNVPVEWIKACGEDKVKQLIKNVTYSKILLRHIASGNYSAEDRFKLLSVYLDNTYPSDKLSEEKVTED